MNIQPARLLLIHGCIVVLLGLLAGIPYWWSIIRKADETISRAWRAAHATVTLAGMLMLVVGLLEGFANLSSTSQSVLRAAFIVSGYSFAFALIIGAITGRRALWPTASALDMLLFAGHFLGAVGAVVGMGLLLSGLF